jgi:hypothetical protein
VSAEFGLSFLATSSAAVTPGPLRLLDQVGDALLDPRRSLGHGPSLRLPAACPIHAPNVERRARRVAAARVIDPSGSGAGAGSMALSISMNLRLPTPAVFAEIEVVCSCGITFEPLPWFDPESEEPVCDECADGV